MAAADSFIPAGFNPSPYEVVKQRAEHYAEVAQRLSARVARLDNETSDLANDLGDPDFYITRRIALLTADYPASEALWPSIQAYIQHLEKQLNHATDHTSKQAMLIRDMQDLINRYYRS